MSKLLSFFQRPFKQLFIWFFCACAICGVSLFSYMYWEGTSLTLKKHESPTACLPNFSGLKILIVTDIHSQIKMLDDMVALAEQTKPDLVFFLGDLFTDFNRISHTGKYITALKRLSALAPAYACLGNHDMSQLSSVARVLKEARFTLLRNEATFITLPRFNDAKIKIIGVGDLREGDCFPQQCMTPLAEAEPDSPPVIVLSHNPMARNILSSYQWNFMVSGHTHGGQICIPLLNKAIFLEAGETMDSGFFNHTENRTIFVSPGVGYVGPGRFNCPPEVSLITIR